MADAFPGNPTRLPARGAPPIIRRLRGPPQPLAGQRSDGLGREYSVRVAAWHGCEMQIIATIAERSRPWGAAGTTRPSLGHSSRPAAVGRPSAHYRLQRLRVPVSDFVPAEILENVLAGLGAHPLPALRVVQQFDDDPGKAFRVVPVE